MESLGFHGDAELAPGLVDLAVNVRPDPLPDWLAEPIAASLRRLAAYPDPGPARAALAARHGRDPEEVLLTAGAAQAFTLLAQARLGVARPVVVHPQFTEPEAALAAAGHRVERAVLPPPFLLTPEVVREAADLVVIGNPTNPTSVAHPAEIVARLAAVQPLWPVSSPALAAALACATPHAVAAEEEIARELAGRRDHLVAGLDKLGMPVAGTPASSFVLVHVPDGEAVRHRLRSRGFAVRRGDSFPGLGPDWLRIAVRDTATSDSFLTVLEASLA